MSMSNYGCHADTVGYGFVKEQCPDEYQAFVESLDNANINFDDFCSCTQIDDELETEEDKAEVIDTAYEALKKAFNEKIGLELGVVHYSAEERSDELDGGSFSVDGVYTLSEAGKKYKDKIVRKAWTVFG